jgi:hypothetical protein
VVLLRELPLLPRRDEYRAMNEDELLCKHEWMDMYGAIGTHRDNPNVALVGFYCKHCLTIRIKTYNQSQFKLNPDAEEERQEHEDGDAEQTA